MAMWGVSLIVSPSLAPGTFVVGAFSEACILFQRQQLTVDISYENEDDFVKNLATLRGEMRAALAVALPAGVITGTLPAAGAATAAKSK